MDSLQSGPTFEDLSINDELSQLERVVLYSSSSIALQRLVHVKMLAETAAAVGFEETVKSIVPLLRPLAEDQEVVVRQHLGEQLDEIARFCKAAGKEAGYRLIIEIVLPTLARLLGDPNADVRQAAGESLVGVASLMKPLDLGHHVLTIVLQLAHDDEQEELRMTAAALLNDLAESLGNDLCKQFVTPEMESLSEDPGFRVRKATALNLHKICRVVEDKGIQRLLKAYIRLTNDDVYRVRKACTEALVEMSKAIGAERSLEDLTPVFLDLAGDSSKLVRTGALQYLGRLISTLPGEKVSQDLVSYFTGTAVESMDDPPADEELRFACARSYPAVVITIGPSRWSELRDSFAALLRDPSWRVRKTLSHSLHEVAKVLTPEDVEMDLVPAMEVLLRDMEEIRLGVIRHLADFFKQMTSDRREKHLSVLVEILQTTSPFNWRLREVLAQQLPDLAPLLTLDSVFFSVVPVAFGLLNDPVAVVRQKTFEVVAPLLQLAGAHSGARQASMVSRVRELAHAHTYQARQMYVYICHSMACSANATHERPLFVQEFVPSLAELARDSVVNVRIALSRALSKCPDWVMELPDIRRAIHHLVNDSNPDVRHFVSFLPPILGHDLSQEDKLTWVESSSVLSDESVLTQWSVSTQRSMISVGDFPHLRDASSPNSRSFKLGRQRSSSIESAGESGNSTTSSEGEGLRRLSSRRPPLPAGWGLPVSTTTTSSVSSTSSIPPPGAPPSGGNGAASNGGGIGAGSENGAAPPPEGGKAEDPATTAGTSSSGADEATKGAGGGEEGVLFEGEGDGDGDGGSDGGRGDALPHLPPAPKRATSQEAAVMDDDATAADIKEDIAVPPIVVSPPEEGSPSVAARRASLTLAEETAAEEVVNKEGMLPPTPLPDSLPLNSAGLRTGSFGADLMPSPLDVNSGLLEAYDASPPYWTGAEDGAEPKAFDTAGVLQALPLPGATVEAAAEAGKSSPLGGQEGEAYVGEGFDDSALQRSLMDVTPPQWDDAGHGSAGLDPAVVALAPPSATAPLPPGTPPVEGAVSSALEEGATANPGAKTAEEGVESAESDRREGATEATLSTAAADDVESTASLPPKGGNSEISSVSDQKQTVVSSPPAEASEVTAGALSSPEVSTSATADSTMADSAAKLLVTTVGSVVGDMSGHGGSEGTGDPSSAGERRMDGGRSKNSTADSASEGAEDDVTSSSRRGSGDEKQALLSTGETAVGDSMKSAPDLSTPTSNLEGIQAGESVGTVVAEQRESDLKASEARDHTVAEKRT